MKRTLVFTIAMIFAGTLHASGAGSPAQDRPGMSGDPVTMRIFASAESEFGKCPVGALSIAVVRGVATESRQFGHTDGEDGPAPTGSTIYRLGSVTKNFTALAFLKLESSDRCWFSDSVVKYVPEFAKIPSPPPSGTSVTLIQLATHTSGLAGDPEDADPLRIGPVAEWKRTLLQAVPKTRFVADPGSLFSYSNIGYAFLGAALEKVAGVPFTQYLIEQVLVPLGMRDTVFELSTDQRTRLAPGWVVSEHGASKDESELELAGRGYRVPAGGLFSTLDDMTRWLQFQMGRPHPEVFEPEALGNAQRRFVTSGPGLNTGYGIGVQFRRFGDAVVLGHSGGVPGYQAEMYFDPERDLGIVILRSAVFGDFDTEAILGAAFDADE